MKAALVYRDIEYPSTHNHAQLMLVAGKNKVPIPADFRGVKDDIYFYEKVGRYGIDFIVNDKVYQEVYAACKHYVSLVSNEIYTEAIYMLRDIVPDYQKKLDDTDLLNMCWKMLPTR